MREGGSDTPTHTCSCVSLNTPTSSAMAGFEVAPANTASAHRSNAMQSSLLRRREVHAACSESRNFTASSCRAALMEYVGSAMASLDTLSTSTSTSARDAEDGPGHNRRQ